MSASEAGRLGLIFVAFWLFVWFCAVAQSQSDRRVVQATLALGMT